MSTQNKISQVVIITDCRDSNARMRQVMRAQALFGVPTVFCEADTTLQAGGMIIDALDAALDTPLLILANMAPRNGEARRHENGTPFGYARVGNAWIFGTIDGYVFSLLQRMLKDTVKVRVFDIPTAVHHLGVEEMTASYIVETQFRSFEFLPRAAARTIANEGTIPTRTISGVALAPFGIWNEDNFGNLKMSALPEDINFEPGRFVTVRVPRNWWSQRPRGYTIRCYRRLKDVPDNQLGLVIGSSGYKHDRWLELVVQGASAAKRCALKPGIQLRITAYPKRVVEKVREREMTA